MNPLLTTPFEGIPNLELILQENPSWLDEAIDDREAGRIRGKTPAAQAVERSRGLGPDYIKDGRTVRYTRRSIFEYLAVRRVRVSS